MSKLLDAELIEGLRTNNFKILDQIYEQFLPKITPMILQNKGTEDDAMDVFQEAIVVLFNRLQSPDFEIKSNFFNYFYGICKFMWLRQLKKKARSEVTLENEEALPDRANIEQEIFETERRQFYKEKFAELSEECQSVLQYFFDGKPLKEIAKLMGYTNDYVKKKKYKCKERLAGMIQGDKRFAEYT